MANACPDCGSAMEFEVQLSAVRTGTCSACGHGFTLVGGEREGGKGVAGPTSDTGVSRPSDNDADDVEAEEETPGTEIACPSCGEALMFTTDGEGHVGASCSGCESRFDLRPAGEESRPSRRPGPYGEDRRGPASGGPGPRGRPCRECGGVLRFSTAPDGGVAAECSSCGNRFTLPPRDDRGRGERRPYGRGFNRPPGGRGGFRRPRDDGGSGRRYGRADRSSGPGFDEDRKRRRRRPE